jgi:alkanesulfonate monooxygenase SsuD/methylene tetrahydromethanopterin reductase-like flavin-dependent oxidoreductase (luciferase family)
MSRRLETTRDSRVLEDVEALGGTVSDPVMVPRPRPAPPVPVMAASAEPAGDVRRLLKRLALCWLLWPER